VTAIHLEFDAGHFPNSELMAFPARASWQASQRLAPTAAIMGMALLTVALLTGLTSLLGENYRADPPFFDPFRAPTRDEAVVVYPAEYALKSAEYNDVLFLGDSTCRCSIDPAVFQRASGLSAYNLGSMGALGMDGYQLILQIYLRHHPKPRAVVLAVTPDDFDVEVSGDAGTWAHLFRWSYAPDQDAALRLPRDVESVKFFARRGVQIGREYWAHSFAERRFDPRDAFLQGGGKYTYLTMQDKISRSRGYWSLAGKHWPGGTEPPNKPTVTVARQWDPGVRELSNLADAGGVSLFIRLVPIVDTVKTDYEPVRRWLNDLEREYPRLTVIRPEILLYNPDLCWDYQHLNSEGVEKFSQSLAKDVAAALSQRAKRPLARDHADTTAHSPIR
jgi:hypothetical protein